MKRKIIIPLFVLISICNLSKAQDYITALGLRAGFSNGFTVKHFVSHTGALEGILGVGWYGSDLTGLYEVHKFGIETEGLNWYYGGGAHIGVWNDHYNTRYHDHGSQSVIGIDGILGMEYNFKDIPLNLSFDWKPLINFAAYSGFWGYGFALSARYIL